MRWLKSTSTYLSACTNCILLAFKMLNQIEETQTVTNVERIHQIKANSKRTSESWRAVLKRSNQLALLKCLQLLEELQRRQVRVWYLFRTVWKHTKVWVLNARTLCSCSPNSTPPSTSSLMTPTWVRKKAVDELTSTLNLAQWSLSVISRGSYHRRVYCVAEGGLYFRG